MRQHDAATAVAKFLDDAGVSSVRTVEPIEGGDTFIIADLFGSRLSVTVEILAQP